MPIDLKTSSLEELQKLSGMGNRHAEEIIEFRQANPLESWEDAEKIPGFSEEMIKSLQSQGVTVNGKSVLTSEVDIDEEDEEDEDEEDEEGAPTETPPTP